MSLGDASERLRSLLEDIQHSVGSPIQQRSTGSTMIRDVMCDVFNVDRGDTLGLHVAYSKMLSLVRDIESDLSHIENNELYMNICRSLRDALAIDNLEIQSHAYVQRFAPLLDKLLFTSDVIQRNKNIKKINEDELKSVLFDIQLVENEVLDADIDGELKKFILQKLWEIQQAIAEYKISGIDGLQEVLEKCIGAVVVRGMSNVDVRGDNEQRMIRRLFDVLGKVGMLVSLGENGTKLVTSGFHLLLGQPPHP